MSGDNRIFNVNGETSEFLMQVLQMAFMQESDSIDVRTTVYGYRVSETHGFILYQYQCDKATAFPCPLSAEQVFPIVQAWLQSSPKCEMKGWDADCDHDGSNDLGWRVYCEDWGHVGGDMSAFVAIKPAFIWCGK